MMRRDEFRDDLGAWHEAVSNYVRQHTQPPQMVFMTRETAERVVGCVDGWMTPARAVGVPVVVVCDVDGIGTPLGGGSLLEIRSLDDVLARRW